MGVTQPEMNADTAPRGLSGQGLLPFQAEALGYAAKGVVLVDSVSFTLEPGPPTVIMGPNGAGKSLLLRLCHGLIEPTSGRAVWAGGNHEDIKLRQAMVFQKPVLLRRSVAGNVDYGLKLRNIGKAERRGRVDEVLHRTGLKRFADTPARLLSGGEQQKLALARAWALRPDVLFLDEPTANLDPAAIAAVEDIVRAMHADGTRIVMVTHDIGQARRIAGEVMFMHKGRLLEKTPAASFFGAPASGEAAAFLRGELRW